jgi:hypothetical protein
MFVLIMWKNVDINENETNTRCVIYVCICVRVRVCVCVCMHACMDVCTYVWTWRSTAAKNSDTMYQEHDAKSAWFNVVYVQCCVTYKQCTCCVTYNVPGTRRQECLV